MSRGGSAARLVTHLARHLERRWAFFSILAFYAASRFTLAIIGVRLSASEFPTVMQFLPAEDLGADLWRSLLYLHAQPPLFNALLGIGLKFFGGAQTFYAAVFWIGGFVFHVLLFRLWRELGLGRLWAWGLLILYSLNPTLVLYEHWLFYSFWESLLLLACGYSLLCLGQSGAADLRSLLAYTATSSALLLTRALYNLAWIAGFAALLLFVLRRVRGRIRLRTVAIVAHPLGIPE